MADDNTLKLIIEPTVEAFYGKDKKYGVYYARLYENLTPEFTVVKNKTYDTVTLVGTMPQLRLEAKYTVFCTESSSKYGPQYDLVSFESKKVDTSEEQFDFLMTILTPLQVESFRKVYDKPIDEILKDTFDYKLVKGIGSKSYAKIKKRILDNYIFFHLLAELGKFGITYKQISKLYSLFNDSNKAIEAVKDNPYILTKLSGVGFKIADQIALKMGIAEDSPLRILACTEYILTKESEAGHTWAYLSAIQYGVNAYIGTDVFSEMTLGEYIIKDTRFTFLPDEKICLTIFYRTEHKIADGLLNLIRHNTTINIDVEAFLVQQEQRQKFFYDEKQREIFYSILKHNLFILTGAAGCGKSSTINGLLNMFDQSNTSYALMSPSAKAAKVLESFTGREATTIHRGLGWQKEGFTFNEENPLPYDVVVIDEISMVGIFLFSSVLKAIDINTKLILVGDSFQIPSIEPGSILDDMLKSNKFANVQLTKIFRQAEKSGIIQIATATRNGKCFMKNQNSVATYYGEDKDTFVVPVNNEKTADLIMRSYAYLLKKGYTDNDIIVLLPSKKNDYGTLEVNKKLQEVNNPPSYDLDEYVAGYKKEITFRVKDKVIHTKNNYEAVWLYEDEDGEYFETSQSGIFNGDIGRIVAIKEDDEDNLSVYVDYGNKVIKYDTDDLNQLEHAWALTIHKFQGSQSKAVILAIDSNNYFMSKRNLIYTGITRCSETLIFFCDPSIINMGIGDNEILKKRTLLIDFLKE